MNVDRTEEAQPVEDGPDATATKDDDIVAALRTVYDPEIPVNIYDLGLIYGIDRGGEGDVGIQMTLTSPNCPEAEMIPLRVEQAVLETPGVDRVNVEIVWEPPWTPDALSEAAKLELGLI